jgi:hypothetical protein
MSCPLCTRRCPQSELAHYYEGRRSLRLSSRGSRSIISRTRTGGLTSCSAMSRIRSGTRPTPSAWRHVIRQPFHFLNRMGPSWRGGRRLDLEWTLWKLEGALADATRVPLKPPDAQEAIPRNPDQSWSRRRAAERRCVSTVGADAKPLARLHEVLRHAPRMCSIQRSPSRP